VSGDEGPLPASPAPIGAGGAGAVAASWAFVLAAVDRGVLEVQADDPVIGGQGFFRDGVEDTGRDPFVASCPQRRVRDRATAEPFGHDPRAAGHQTDQHRFEAHPVRDAAAVTAEGMGPRQGRDQRLDRCPDGIYHLRVQGAHDDG
jgi:hypothetical protein